MASTRTILINGDPTWQFVDLLWAHGMDLYPRHSGIHFISALPAVDAAQNNPNYRLILGNFPESFGEDPTSLVNEISDEVSDLDIRETGTLSILAVVSAEDFDTLAKWSADATDSVHAERLQKLSPGGQATVGALRAAMERIGDLSGDQGRISRLAPRLWLALAVRERGFDPAHKLAARAVMQALAGRHAGLKTVFFLSNGRGLDAGIAHPSQHFIKLRLVLDILMGAHEANCARELKATGARNNGGVFWVRLPEDRPPYLDYPAALLSTLVEAYENMRAGGEAQGEVETEFRATSAALLNQIRPAANNQSAEAQLRQIIEPGKKPGPNDEEKHPTSPSSIESTAKSYTKSRRGPILRSPQRVKNIRDDVNYFEDEIGLIFERLNAATVQAIDTETQVLRTGRQSVQNQLAELRIPQNNKPVEGFRAALRKHAQDFGGAMAAAATLTKAPDRDGHSLYLSPHTDRNQREALKARLIAAEENLLGWASLFKIPILLAIIILSAPLIMLAGRANFGTFPIFSLNTMIENVFPIFHILIFVVLASLAVGFFRTLDLARRRDQARQNLGWAMLSTYLRHLQRSSSHLARGVNRKRLSLVNMILSRLGLVDPAMITAATDSVIESLSLAKLNLDIQRNALPQNARSAAQAALSGFHAGALRPEKVTGFLKSIERPPAGSLDFQLPGPNRLRRVASQAGIEPPLLSLTEPGND